MCKTVLLGAATCAEPAWREVATTSSVVAFGMFAFILLVALLSWALDACKSQGEQRQDPQRKRRASLSVPIVQRRLVVAYTPDTRAVVASSRACFLEWAAFAIMPQAPTSADELTEAAKRSDPRVFGRSGSSPSSFAESSRHTAPVLVAPASSGRRTMSRTSSTKRVARLLARDEEWDPCTDDIEAAEAIGVTSRSAIEAEGESEDGGFLGTLQRQNSLPEQCKEAMRDGGTSPKIRVVANKAQLKAQSRIYGPCMRRTFGATAGAAKRRLVTCSALVETVRFAIVAFSSSTSPALLAAIALLSSISWTLITWLALITVWYWVRLARSSSRLFTIHSEVAKRNSGMAGSSVTWDSSRRSSGLAAPFDATADPFAGSILCAMVGVFATLCITGAAASLINMRAHVECLALGEAHAGNSSLIGAAAVCQRPAYPGTAHASVVSVGLILLALASANAGSALLRRFRRLAQKSSAKAANLRPRRWLPDQISLAELDVGPVASSGTILGGMDVEGEQKRAAIAQRAASVAPGALAVGKALLKAARHGSSAGGLEAGRVSSFTSEAPGMIGSRDVARGSLASTEVGRSDTGGTAASGLVVGGSDHESEVRFRAARREALMWWLTHKRLQRRVWAFGAGIVILGLSALADIAVVGWRGTSPMLFLTAKALQGLIFAAFQVSAWHVSTSASTLDVLFRCKGCSFGGHASSRRVSVAGHRAAPAAT